MKTFVKLSGLTEPEAVKLVPDGGAAGFIIDVPGSPRSLSIEAAAALLDSVPTEAEAWAVVSRPSAELVHRLFDEIGVDRVQVYGPIPDGLEYLEIHHLVPSLPVPAAGSSDPDPPVPPADDYVRLHLDLAGDPLGGGSEHRPDWERCARMVNEQPGRKLVLAGGLTAENVAEALGVVRPWGLDVGRGIERPTGGADPQLIRAFLAAVKATESPPG
ncbi:MAG: hypothetical protein L3K09_00870 [Thermoplasmata archaeon]|nr:hypothetical protein [Thermoplasmata archaeon]